MACFSHWLSPKLSKAKHFKECVNPRLLFQIIQDLKIIIDQKEIIPFDQFVLSWRWKPSHNSNISEIEKNQIRPFSEMEAKRLDKVINFFESESNLRLNFEETDWMTAGIESEEVIEKFRKQLSIHLDGWNENVIITWGRKTALTTTKSIFIKYWDDFFYPSSDDVTVISENTNWVIFYRHLEVANIWKRKLSSC
jgi:hypothetical protein